MPRKITVEKIKKMQKQADQLRARLNREEKKVREQSRKYDTRRKIIIGAAVLRIIDEDEEIGPMVRRLIPEYLNEQDQKFVGL